MISDWRGERRIGHASFNERVASALRPALAMIVILAAGSAFIVLIKRLDDPLNWYMNLRFWALLFAFLVGLIGVGSFLSPRKDVALAVGVIGGVLAGAVWFMALPILRLFGVAMIVPTT